MKDNLKNYSLLIVQHKNFYYFISLFLSSAIIYYSYTYYIKQSYEKIGAVKINIGKVKSDQLIKSNTKLKKKKKELRGEYEKLLDSKNSLEIQMYKNVYDVVVDVMTKLNNSSFNIYKYELNKDYSELKLEMNGSYLNLIKLFDYLQTIKANIIINDYTIELVDNKMLIKLQLKVGILKI
jgi:hypothetical protein